MRLSDIERVMAIERTAFPTPWKASAYEYEITKNRLADYQVLTVALGDQPTQLIGYAGGWLIAGETHISTIAVSDAWRGQGLGDLLLLNLLLRAYDDGAELATLEVRVRNVVAQALYKKFRFEVVGKRRRYYQGKEDALIMSVEPLDSTYRSFLRREQGNLFERLTRDRESVGSG